MLIRLRFTTAASLFACLFAGSAYAQEIPEPSPAPAPANLAFVDGVVDVTQGGVTEPADPPMMLLEGDVVHTRAGRAELVFGDGTLLHIAPESEVEILGDERLRLQAGRVQVRLSHAASRPYVIDTPLSSVRLDAQGEYGVDAARGGRLQVTVARGSAQVDAGETWVIRGGEMITVIGTAARPLIEPFNSARFDSFMVWSHDRATGATHALSAAQLPYELRPYAPVLDRHGRWSYVAPHGYVWFPSVGVSWRPYYEGSWSFTRYGWTWHGRDRWAWPTHHYGRWGYTGAFWYWIPSTVWAPAWVSWSVGAGYVSWAPLGWHSPGRFDAWPSRDHPAYAPQYSPWRGWTVLPRQHFGPRKNVRAHAVDGDRLDDAARRALLSRVTPSRTRDDFAVPRNSVSVPGNVRRPPATNTPRAADRAPARVTDAPVRPSGREDPAYSPRSWSGAARGAGTTGEGTRRDAPKDSGAAAPERRGAVRDPALRSAPRSSEGGERGASGRPSPRSSGGEGARTSKPADRSPRSKPAGAAGGAAVPRSGSPRPKG
jgi:hypothetical protein